MIIGVPKEIKLQEHRIGLTPESVQILTSKKHKVLIENNGGKIASNVTKKLDYLVIGEKPTNKKIEQAKKIGVEIISQSALNNLLN